jgi:sugar lactone lactonase YvrE
MSDFVYSSAPALNAIVRTNMRSDEMKLFATDLHSPQGLGFAPDGTLFVVEGASGQLSVVDGNGKTRKHADGLVGPTGLAFDATGGCYVIESVGDCIKWIHPDGTAATIASGIGNPNYVAFDGVQNFYCGGGPNHHVYRVDLFGHKTLFHELNAPASGIACDADQNVYVSGERITGQGASKPYIARFTPAGDGQVFAYGTDRGSITVYGSTANGYLIYSIGPNTIGTFRTQEWSYVRRTAWAEYAATPRDFSYPPP